MSQVKIGNKIVGGNTNVKFTAELGVNHLGSFERAKEMIDSSLNAGSDFLKFQTYISEQRYDKIREGLIAFFVFVGNNLGETFTVPFGPPCQKNW